MHIICVGVLMLAGVLAAQEKPPELVSFTTQDGGTIFADVYGAGERGVVLAHGGRFNKESWAKQARELAAAGFRVVAIDFRGYGKSRGPGDKDVMSAPLHFDVLAAVRWLRANGAKSVYALGGSLGGGASADAAITAPNEIDRLVMLGAEGSLAGMPLEKLTVRKLFIMTRDDTGGGGPRLPRLQKNYAKCPEPKKLVILEGSAHAQFIFDTPQGAEAMREIMHFLRP